MYQMCIFSAILKAKKSITSTESEPILNHKIDNNWISVRFFSMFGQLNWLFNGLFLIRFIFYLIVYRYI